MVGEVVGGDGIADREMMVVEREREVSVEMREREGLRHSFVIRVGLSDLGRRLGQTIYWAEI